jgi:cell division septation protein DedD
MSRRLRRAGLPAYVRRSNVKGVGLRYRVRVGPYGDFDEAKGAAGRLRLQQRLPAYVTRED